jgi:hypothetical protein
MKYSILLLVLCKNVSFFVVSWCNIQITDMFVIRKTDTINEQKKTKINTDYLVFS